MIKKVCLFSFLILLACFGRAQTVFNGDLNGIITGISCLPNGWQAVPVGDPACIGSFAGSSDTPDLTDINGPNAIAGTFGIPYSGATFVSGVKGDMGGGAFLHEGIMQSISGFTVGQMYTVSFFQTVVKQSNFPDSSGSWSVYVDNTLAGISAPCYTNTAYNDVNLSWYKRSISFTATASTHTLKFLPEDDDTNLAEDVTTGGIRMGIDSIWIEGNCNISVNLGPDTSFCQSSSLVLNATTSNATYVWQDNSTASSFNVTASGNYWVTVTSNGCSTSDSVQIILKPLPLVSLSNNVTIKASDSIQLSAAGGIMYTWSPTTSLSCNSCSNPIAFPEESTSYCVALTNTDGCTDNACVVITVNDLFCEQVFIPDAFTPDNNNLNDVFKPVTNCVHSYEMLIFNRWGQQLFKTEIAEEGWNGYYKEDACKQDIYIYKITFADDVHNHQRQYIGKVILWR